MSTRTIAIATAIGLSLTAVVSAQIVANSPTAKATVTVGDQTFTFQRGGCLITAESWAMALGDMTKAQHFELNIPAPNRAKAADAVKPVRDGSYTNVSLTVIVDATKGVRWHAGGRTAKEARLTVTLKNNRRGGAFPARTHGSPRQDIKGSFTS
jgi:hypothetical protein